LPFTFNVYIATSTFGTTGPPHYYEIRNLSHTRGYYYLGRKTTRSSADHLIHHLPSQGGVAHLFPSGESQPRCLRTSAGYDGKGAGSSGFLIGKRCWYGGISVASGRIPYHCPQ